LLLILLLLLGQAIFQCNKDAFTINNYISSTFLRQMLIKLPSTPVRYNDLYEFGTLTLVKGHKNSRTKKMIRIRTRDLPFMHTRPHIVTFPTSTLAPRSSHERSASGICLNWS